MSLLRHPIYAWSDGRSMHLWARQGTEGVFDPIHYGTEGSEHYPLFVSGVAMPMDVWDEIVTRYLAVREEYLRPVEDDT